MSKYTITPWRSQHDLFTVRAQFYRLPLTPDTTTDHRRHAVDRVMAWKLRGNLPHAIESTALLTDAILHHDIPDNSSFSVRAVYSAAFTRFVTGFCDIGRNRERSLEPSSMLVIAKQINMPVHFVALRHEATHEEMPSLQRLVRATDEALQWLWTVYWSRLEEPETDEAGAGDLAALRTNAKQIFRSYRTARLEALRSNKRHADGEVLLKTGESCVLLLERNQHRIQAFVDVLVKEKILMPQKRELGQPLDGAYMIWDALLQFLVDRQKRFLCTLIQSLLEYLNSDGPSPPEQDVQKEGALLWILHILNWRGEASKLRLMAMKWCCMNPGHWSTKLGENILRIEDAEFRSHWREIFEASQLDFEMVSADDVMDAETEDAQTPVAERNPEYADAASWIRAPAPIRGPIGMSI